MEDPGLAALSGSLLVICTANVCRSPLAAALLDEALNDVEVGSAGVQAVEGATMCTVSAAQLPEGVAPQHIARQLTADLVRAADLVITMEREQRSAAVRLAPGSQSKVFTLREVAALLRGLPDRPGSTPSDLEALASALHRSRGIVPIPMPEAPRRRWWQRQGAVEDPLTIVDGHGWSDQQHADATQQVADVSRDVIESLRALRSHAEPGGSA